MKGRDAPSTSPPPRLKPLVYKLFAEDGGDRTCIGAIEARQGGFVSIMFTNWGYDDVTAGILGNFCTMLPVACLVLLVSALIWEANGRAISGTSRVISRGFSKVRKSRTIVDLTASSTDDDEDEEEEEEKGNDKNVEAEAESATDDDVVTQTTSKSTSQRHRRKRRKIFDHALWFRYWLRLNKDFLIEACGVDGMEYLIFQRHLVGLLFIVSVIGLVIILPINSTSGTLGETVSYFFASSLGNVSPDSQSLWFHVTTGFFVYPICMLTMKDFARKLRYLEDRSLILSRTLILSGLPGKVKSEQDVAQHLKKQYPGVSVRSVSFCMRVAEITSLLRERAFNQIVLSTMEKHGQGDAKKWNSVLMGFLCPGWTSGERQADFYRDRIKVLDLQILLCLKTIKSSLPLDSAFVTLSSVHQARCLILFHNYRRNYRRRYTMHFAPPAKSVIWENITPQYWIALKEWMVDLGLIAFIIIFEAPEILAEFILTGVSRLYSALNDPTIKSLMYLGIGLLTHKLVFMCSSLLGYWTEGKINEKIFVKTYSILIIKFFIFPILSLTSVSVLFQIQEEGLYLHALRWDCIFLPDNGAIFINNMVTMALLGNTFALLRFDLVLEHLYALLVSRSWSELLVRIRRVSRTNFWIGLNLVWIMMNFTITISLGIMCPLILPVGLAYMVTRHYVDSYNLINGYYKLPKVNTKMTYQLAISVVLFSACSLQFLTTAFMLIRSTTDQGAHASAVCGAFLCMSSITFTFFQMSAEHTWPIKIFKQESLVESVSRNKILAMETPYFPPLLMSYLNSKRATTKD